MGSTCTKSTVQYEKKVVIIGCSFAGLTLAEQLWDSFEVVIVDKNDYFEFICSNSKSLVNDEHFNNTSLHFAQYIRQHSNKATFMQGALEEIVPSDNFVVIKTNTEKENERIDYDFLVICTGSSYQ